MILQLLQRRRNRPTKPAPSLDQLIERCRYAEAAFAEAQGDYEIDAAIHDMAVADAGWEAE